MTLWLRSQVALPTGLGFYSQRPQGSSQPSRTPILRRSTALFWWLGALHAHGIQAYERAQHLYTLNKSKKYF